MKFKKRWREVFIYGDTAAMEVVGGLVAMMACASALVYDSNDMRGMFGLTLVITIVQVLAAFPFGDLKWRHYTNIISMITYVTIAIQLAEKVGISDTGVGGFLGVGLMAGFCAFKTKMELE